MAEKEEFEINFKGFPVRCSDFKPDTIQPATTVTAIIVPIQIVRNGGRLRVTWACNRGKYCYADCIYAIARQEYERKLAQEANNP